MKYCDKCRSSYPQEFNVCPIDNSVLRLSSSLLPGMTIRDKYLILDKLGEGGMGVVYRARHLAFGEILAIKVVHSSLAENADFLKRFKTEAIVARKLRHANAVRIEDLDSTEDGRPFIVMEFVAGTDLRSLIAGKESLPVERAVRIAMQVADVLSEAHQFGIVHRDIKPDNILLARGPADTDIVKVADFGIAKVLEGSLDVGSGYASTRSGVIVGTPQYLSPEQAMGHQGSRIDGRADLYSLGVVLYMMLTGRLPFESDTPMGFLVHHVQTPPTPPNILRPDLHLPPSLSWSLMKALEKDRDRRFASADEMKCALQIVLQPPEAAFEPSAKVAALSAPVQRARLETPPTLVAPDKQSRPQHRFVVFSVLAVLVVAIASLAAYLLLGHSRAIVGQEHPQDRAVNRPSQPSSPALVINTPESGTSSAEPPPPQGQPLPSQAKPPAGHTSLPRPPRPTNSTGGHELSAATATSTPIEKPVVQAAASESPPQQTQPALQQTQPPPPPPQTSPETAVQDHLARADHFFKRRQWNEAIAEFRAALQLQPNNSMVHNNLGLLLEMSGAGERVALEEYQKACELDPRNAAARANYERVREDLGK